MQVSQALTSRRRTWRGRTPVAARIVATNGGAALDCLVRKLSESAAELHVSSKARIPDEFSLFMVKKNVTRKARVTWRRGDVVEIEFLRPVSAERPAESAHEADSEAELLQRISTLEAENERLRARVRLLSVG